MKSPGGCWCDPECALYGDCCEFICEPEEEDFVWEISIDEYPVDYIMAIDGSGSMTEEIDTVQANLNTLTGLLVDAKIDYRFVLISERGQGELQMCVDPPMGMGPPSCGDTSNFSHINQYVDSWNAFEVILGCESGCEKPYGTFLRPDSILHVIVVTDDFSDLSWSNFNSSMAAKGLLDFTLHAIVAWPHLHALVNPIDPDVPCGSGIGSQYWDGVSETGGELFHICSADWGTKFSDAIFDSTLATFKSAYPLVEGEPIDGSNSIEVYAVIPPSQDKVLLEEGTCWKWEWDGADTVTVHSKPPGCPNFPFPEGTEIVVDYQKKKDPYAP